MTRAVLRPSARPAPAHPPSLARRIIEAPAAFRGRDGALYLSLPAAAAFVAAACLAGAGVAELAIAAIKWAVPA